MAKSGELIRLLFGKMAEEAIVPDDRLRRWVEAFDDWLEVRRRDFSQNVGKDSYAAWKDFLTFKRKAPWDIQVEDVEAYIEDLKGKGLRAGTIQRRLTGLKKFYEYCQENEIDAQCVEGFNPVAKVRRPKVEMYKKANYLSQEEEKALLEAIGSDPSATGKRDHALFTLLLRTGCGAGEARRLRWRDVKIRRGTVWIKFKSKSRGEGERGSQGEGEPRSGGARERESKGERDQIDEDDVGRMVELTMEVWTPLLAYLKASGRIGVMQPNEYVFAPGKEPLVREAGENPEDWAVERPLSMDQLHYLLKLYAEWADLKAEEITCHTLRHTAVKRWVEEEGEEAALVRMGRTNTIKAKEYLKMLQDKPCGNLQRYSNGKLSERNACATTKGQVPSRGPNRTKPRNLLALKHGLTANYLPELEWLEENGIRLRGIERQIVRWRVVIWRAVMLSYDVDSVKKAIPLLEAEFSAGIQLSKLGHFYHEHGVQEKAALAMKALQEGVDDDLREEWLKLSEETSTD
jgi:integrase